MVKYFKASFKHESHKHKLKHFLYSGGWKKFEAVWNFMIKTKNLNSMLPLLESILSKVKYGSGKEIVNVKEQVDQLSIKPL